MIVLRTSTQKRKRKKINDSKTEARQETSIYQETRIFKGLFGKQLKYKTNKQKSILITVSMFCIQILKKIE